MSATKKISLSSMLDRLQDIENYKNPHVAFNALLYGWRVQNKHTTQWLNVCRRRDTLSYQLAKDFAQYCLQNDWQKMMPN